MISYSDDGNRVTVTYGGASLSWNTKRLQTGHAPYRVVANAKPGCLDDLLTAVQEAFSDYPADVDDTDETANDVVPEPEIEPPPDYDEPLAPGGPEYFETAALEALSDALWCFEHQTTLAFCRERVHHSPNPTSRDARPQPDFTMPVVGGYPYDPDVADVLHHFGHTPIRTQLEHLVNANSQENISNTPDFILADFLQTCLDALNTAIAERDRWYSINPHPGWAAEFDNERYADPSRHRRLKPEVYERIKGHPPHTGDT